MCPPTPLVVECCSIFLRVLWAKGLDKLMVIAADECKLVLGMRNDSSNEDVGRLRQDIVKMSWFSLVGEISLRDIVILGHPNQHC
jgi:hypothetical protein